MRFSEATGHKIVSTSDAATVGKVDGLVVDLRGPSVALLEVKKTEHGDTLRWSDIAGFGTDAVTVASADKITDAGEDVKPLLEKSNQVLKKRVLDTLGVELGKVRDVDFDPATGKITALLLDKHGTAEVAGDKLIGIGSYAVVVQA